MKNNVFLLVPSKDNLGLEVNNAEVLQNVILTMSKLFGGTTITNASGSYMAENGNLIIESVVKVESYASELSRLNEVTSLALYVKNTLNQEYVAICVNGEMQFI